MSSKDDASRNFPSAGPYESVREYVEALKERGRLLHIPEIDQDKYEATGLVYRMLEKMDNHHAPALWIDRVKINGNWQEGPVLANLYGSWQDEALTFGVDEIADEEAGMYFAAMEALGKRLDESDNWQRIAPETIDRDSAPCKDVILEGDDVDLEKFPWFKNNPADGGRYVNMGSVFLHDDKIGPNMGTYRCMVKGKNKIAVNPEPGQHGWIILMSKKRRGEKSAKCSIAVGPDPITFAVSSNKMAGLGEDELHIAGGLRGRPVQMVKSESNDLLVPAHAEIIIEGEIPLDQMEEEGPYGEMYGYLGPHKEENFFMNITCITHRQNPWVLNSFTGITHDMPRAPQIASEYYRYKKMLPDLVGFYTVPGAFGLIIAAIDKKMPGQGIMTGNTIAANPGMGKVVVVVDKDANFLSAQSVLQAMGACWQPSAHTFIPQTLQRAPDPSLKQRGLTSKMVIDATRQFPEEGGPQSWPPLSRTLLEEQSPETFALVDEKWQDYWGRKEKYPLLFPKED